MQLSHTVFTKTPWIKKHFKFTPSKLENKMTAAILSSISEELDIRIAFIAQRKKPPALKYHNMLITFHKNSPIVYQHTYLFMCIHKYTHLYWRVNMCVYLTVITSQISEKEESTTKKSLLTWLQNSKRPTTHVCILWILHKTQNVTNKNVKWQPLSDSKHISTTQLSRTHNISQNPFYLCACFSSYGGDLAVPFRCVRGKKQK